VARTLAACLVALLLSIRAQALERIQEPQAPDATTARPEQIVPDAHVRALKKWVNDYTRWKKARDRNRTTFITRLNRPMPDPPEWLFEDCRTIVVDEKSLWAKACRLLVEWKDDEAASEMRNKIAGERAQKEAPTKTIWWEHVHLDALWPMTQWGSSVYGIVGTHATVEVSGRFQVFMAPGAMLLNVPGPGGTREWKLATDWGIAYRLANFRFPGTRRAAQLHANLVTAIVFASPAAGANRVNLAGFSLTFKNPRP